MYSAIRRLALTAISLVAAGTLAFAAPPTDACTVLTTEQVKAALGSVVANGAPISPAFKATCTWNIQSGGSVTLSLQSLAIFNGGKGAMAASERTSASVGDEAYYLGVGPTTGLLVRKGSSAFKVAVYSKDLALEKRKAIELALAQQALSKF